jgi:hypothetical protein
MGLQQSQSHHFAPPPGRLRSLPASVSPTVPVPLAISAPAASSACQSTPSAAGRRWGRRGVTKALPTAPRPAALGSAAAGADPWHSPRSRSRLKVSNPTTTCLPSSLSDRDSTQQIRNSSLRKQLGPGTKPAVQDCSYHQASKPPKHTGAGAGAGAGWWPTPAAVASRHRTSQPTPASRSCGSVAVFSALLPFYASPCSAASRRWRIALAPGFVKPLCCIASPPHARSTGPCGFSLFL